MLAELMSGSSDGSKQAIGPQRAFMFHAFNVFVLDFAKSNRLRLRLNSNHAHRPSCDVLPIFTNFLENLSCSYYLLAVSSTRSQNSPPNPAFRSSNHRAPAFDFAPYPGGQNQLVIPPPQMLK
jgi:hypothetical protein